MRDDIFDLAAFRGIGPGPKLQPVPIQTLSLGAGAGPGAGAGTTSFQQALEQAANARRALPYRSPLARSTPNAPQTIRRVPLPHPRPQTSTITPRSSLDLPPTSITRPRTVPAPAPAPAPPTDTQGQTLPGMPLNMYPRPDGDNGRGLDWVPTTKQSNDVIDKFVADAKAMGVKWVTFLNNGADVGDNDYLVSKLVGAGIEPIMRLYAPTLEPIQGDVQGMVQHYVGMGVHYFQPFNEPNVGYENPDNAVSVDRYLDNWIPVAKAIVAGGGLPGFGAMAPGGDYDDQQFLKDALAGIKARGETGVLDKAWLSMHNYTWNHPIQDRGDGDGFFKFRAYHRIVNAALGRDLPIIGTEGGSFVGEQEDPKMGAVTTQQAADWTAQSMRYMRDQREPWLFASSVWTVADVAGGGSDPRFEAQALFHADGTQSQVVNALERLG